MLALAITPQNMTLLAVRRNLVPNGRFEAGSTSGWLATNGVLSVAGGRLRVTNNTGSTLDCRAYAAVSTVTGQRYRFRGSLLDNSSLVNMNFAIGNGPGFSTIAQSTAAPEPRRAEIEFTAQQVTQYIYSVVALDAGTFYEIDDLEVVAI